MVSFAGSRSSQRRSRFGWAIRQEPESKCWRSVCRVFGHDGETPQEGIAPELFDGSLAGRELGELPGPLLHHGTVVVAAPDGQGVDSRNVGQHVRLAHDVVRVELQPSLLGLDRLRADELDLRYPVRVGPTGMVSFEKNRYSMPAETLGFSATLHAFAHHIMTRTGDHRVSHPRLPAGSPTPSNLEAHRDGLLAAVSGKRGRSYLQRQHLLDLGSDAERFLTEFVHLRPRRWHDDVARLHELLQAHGDAPPGPSLPASRRARNRHRGRHPVHHPAL